MISRFAPLSLVPVLLLTACGDRDSAKGTDISIKDDDGNVVAAADGKSGKISLNIPGISADIKLPKMKLDADNFDIDGVKLYPGTTIETFNINAGKGDGTDKVDVRFTAPASLTSVRDYFVNAMKEEGVSVTSQGSALSGINADGDPFRIDLKPTTDGKTQGVIALTSK